jgi:hypothetical protein
MDKDKLDLNALLNELIQASLLSIFGGDLEGKLKEVQAKIEAQLKEAIDEAYAKGLVDGMDGKFTANPETLQQIYKQYGIESEVEK